MLFSIHDVLGDNILQGLVIVLNLIIIESLLNIDNAAVISAFISRIKPDKQSSSIWKIFACVIALRALSLLFASWLVTIWWLKFFIGLALVFLGIWVLINKKSKAPLALIIAAAIYVGSGMPEMVASIDSVFAAVAFTDNMFLIYIGVFIGVLSMMLTIRVFVKMMNRSPLFLFFLGIVAIIKGISYLAGMIFHFYPESEPTKILDSEEADLTFSIFIVLGAVAVFFYSGLNKVQGKNKPAGTLE